MSKQMCTEDFYMSAKDIRAVLKISYKTALDIRRKAAELDQEALGSLRDPEMRKVRASSVAKVTGIKIKMPTT
ncbi:MAG: hypothetical protein HUJ93_08500, partial [Bacteroidales bacterium]|nr:hypothetical protein [Bacteroidales bacterium]